MQFSQTSVVLRSLGDPRGGQLLFSIEVSRVPTSRGLAPRMLVIKFRSLVSC